MSSSTSSDSDDPEAQEDLSPLAAFRLLHDKPDTGGTFQCHIVAVNSCLKTDDRLKSCTIDGYKDSAHLRYHEIYSGFVDNDSRRVNLAWGVLAVQGNFELLRLIRMDDSTFPFSRVINDSSDEYVAYRLPTESEPESLIPFRLKRVDKEKDVRYELEVLEGDAASRVLDELIKGAKALGREELRHQRTTLPPYLSEGRPTVGQPRINTARGIAKLKLSRGYKDIL